MLCCVAVVSLVSMEEGAGALLSLEEKEKQEKKEPTSSYTYWVRGVTEDAVPLPVPRKLSNDDLVSNHSQPPTLGSIWNRVCIINMTQPKEPFTFTFLFFSLLYIFNVVNNIHRLELGRRRTLISGQHKE